MTQLVRQLNSQDADFSPALKKLLAFDAAEDEAIDLAAAKILVDVKARGDQAVLDYTQKFDRLSKEQASSIKSLEITKTELFAALESLPKEQRTLQNLSENFGDVLSSDTDKVIVDGEPDKFYFILV